MSVGCVFLSFLNQLQGDTNRQHHVTHPIAQCKARDFAYEVAGRDSDMVWVLLWLRVFCTGSSIAIAASWAHWDGSRLCCMYSTYTLGTLM